MLGFLYWDPNPILFIIPYLNHPVRWYGPLFVIGFVLSYYLMVRFLWRKLLLQPDFSERDVASETRLAARMREQGWGFEGAPCKKKLVKFLNGKLNDPSEELEEDAVVLPKLQPRERRRLGLEKLMGDGLHSLKDQAVNLTDKLTLYILLGTVIGARLGHCLFYEWPRYQHDLLSIFKTWEGGLASHGGALGIILALLVFVWRYREAYPAINLLTLLDYAAICSGLVGFFIRVGNFVNQEIVGYPTQLPWAVIFGHPAAGEWPVPRHPVQLYEAFFYLATFGVMMRLWRKRGGHLRQGWLVGLFFVVIFTFRFFIEFVKLPQSMGFDESSLLDMGQLLSLPFVMVGCFLLWRKPKHQALWAYS